MRSVLPCSPRSSAAHKVRQRSGRFVQSGGFFPNQKPKPNCLLHFVFLLFLALTKQRRAKFIYGSEVLLQLNRLSMLHLRGKGLPLQSPQLQKSKLLIIQYLEKSLQNINRNNYKEVANTTNLKTHKKLFYKIKIISILWFFFLEFPHIIPH